MCELTLPWSESSQSNTKLSRRASTADLIILELVPLFQILQHLLDQRDVWLVVAGRVVLRRGQIERFDLAIVDVHGKPLTPRVAQDAHGARSVERSAESFGQLALGIAQDLDDGTLCPLLFCPRGLHSSIIHGEHDDVIDASGLQLSLLLKVPRNLLCGSGGFECSRQAHQYDFL